MAVQTRLITADEFWETVLHDESYQDRRVELVDGEIVDMPPTNAVNSVIAARIISHLNHFVIKRDLGWVTSPNAGFTLENNQVRMIDIAYISKGRFPVLKERFDVLPELAIKIVPPPDSSLQLVSEINLYLRSGIQLLWIVFAEDREVMVCTRSKGEKEGFNAKIMTEKELLECQDILPGYQISLRDIFPPQPVDPQPTT